MALDAAQKEINPKITLEKSAGLKSCPEKIIAAKIAKFLIHCFGRANFNVLKRMFLISFL